MRGTPGSWSRSSLSSPSDPDPWFSRLDTSWEIIYYCPHRDGCSVTIFESGGSEYFGMFTQLIVEISPELFRQYFANMTI